MQPPFSREDFLGVFVAYHDAFALMPIVLAAVGVIGAATLGKRPKLALTICAALWLWMAIAYFAIFFSALSPAGYLFAGLFAAQGFLFLHAAKQYGVAPSGESNRSAAILTMVLVVYALVVYPIVGWLAGQRYPALPTFGLPCPTTIFTLGVLAWWGTSVPARLFVIPTVWAIVGTSAALTLGIIEDLALLPAALVVLAMRVNVRRAAAH
jgi:hypothetical protein